MRSRRGASLRLLLVGAACAVAVLAVWSRGATTGSGPGSTVAPEHGTAPGTRSPGRPRPLVYANGRTVHVGGHAVDTRRDVLSVVAAEGGAGFTTFDGRLWFTDGRTVLPIGVSTRPRVTATGVDWGAGGRPVGRLVSDDDGPDLAWMEYGRDGATRTTIAVLDTRSAEGVLRVPFAVTPGGCGRCAHIVLVRHGFVYVSDTRAADLGVMTAGAGNATLVRVDVATGRESVVPASAYRAELLRSARTLVVGGAHQVQSVESGVGEDFAFVGRRLVLRAVGHQDVASDARTRRPLTLRLDPPAGGALGPTDRFYLVEWLDDDRFALLDTSATRSRGVNQGDIVVCRLSTSRCAVSVHASRDGRWPVVPGVELDGSDRAEALAIRQSRPAG